MGIAYERLHFEEYVAELPPEVLSWRIHEGAGTDTMWAAADAWEKLTDDLVKLADGISSVSEELWCGPSAFLVATAVTAYGERIREVAVAAENVRCCVWDVAGAFETASGAIVPVEEIRANRVLRRKLLQENDVAGINGSAISAVDFEFATMRATNVAAMHDYMARAEAASLKLESSPFSALGRTAAETGTDWARRPPPRKI